MPPASQTARESYDAIIIGSGHNGLIANAYLARAGLRTLLLEARPAFGGPCGTYEFMPGYRCAFTNSPGSFEPKFVQELELEKFGLSFLKTDPTVIHPFERGTFVGWRDAQRLADQLNSYAPGEADRYFGLLKDLEELGRQLSVSVFEPSPDITALARDLPSAMADLFQKVFLGSLRQLLDERLRSEEAKALLGMVALNAALTPPSAPGSAIGLMLRPISLASYTSLGGDDPRKTALRGSTGIPIGGMGAIIDALVNSCRAHGAELRTDTTVARVTYRDGRASGVITSDGTEIAARAVLSAINPKTLFSDLLDDDAVGADIRRDIAALPMRGSAFKLVLALDGLPQYVGLPPDLEVQDAAKVQIRIAPSLDYVEEAVTDGLSGRLSRGPIMWGLMLSATSPGMAPRGRHLLSVNVWHAPYSLSEGVWPEVGDGFADRCVDVLSRSMPDLKRRMIDRAYLDPVQIETELGLVHSNITHGEMLPHTLFGGRPHRQAHDYRTPLKGLFLAGGGTWPGGYVSGISGFNAATTILNDRHSSN